MSAPPHAISSEAPCNNPKDKITSLAKLICGEPQNTVGRSLLLMITATAYFDTDANDVYPLNKVPDIAHMLY